jgi:hypothetical protein
MSTGLKKKGKPKNPDREAKIEHIMAVMRPIADKSGNPTWNDKVRKQLGASWGMTDDQVRKLSAEANKRIIREMGAQDTDGHIARVAALSLHDNLVKTYAREDFKNNAAFIGLAIQMAKSTAKTEITVKTEATPAKAAALAAEIYGARVKRDSSTPVDGAGEEPADGAGEEQGPSDE